MMSVCQCGVCCRWHIVCGHCKTVSSCVMQRCGLVGCVGCCSGVYGACGLADRITNCSVKGDSFEGRRGE